MMLFRSEHKKGDAATRRRPLVPYALVPLEGAACRVKTRLIDPLGMLLPGTDQSLGGAGYRQFIRSPFFHRILPMQFSLGHWCALYSKK